MPILYRVAHAFSEALNLKTRLENQSYYTTLDTLISTYYVQKTKSD